MGWSLPPTQLGTRLGDSERIMSERYTAKQGQYLSFIFYDTIINRCAPAQANMQRYFRVSAPSVHQMILTLEREGLISRIPVLSRSITLNVPKEQLPDLESVDEK